MARSLTPSEQMELRREWTERRHWFENLKPDRFFVLKDGKVLEELISPPGR
jgi:hypothetical protein